MVKTVFYIFLLSLPLILRPFCGKSQQSSGIVLQYSALPFTPTVFYIAHVIDEREEKSAIAQLMSVTGKTGGPAKLYSVDFKGGGGTVIRQFIVHNLPADTQLHPIVFRIKKFMSVERLQPGGNVEGNAVLQFSFGLGHGDEDELPLADFTGNAVYNRVPGAPQEIEPALRHLLISGLVYLNTWMNHEAATNVKLAKTVKVAVTDFNEKTEGDTVYYAVKRPLNWGDFQSTISSSRFDAEVFPSIGYDEHTEVKNGCIHLNLSIKVYVPKSACWVREGSRNAYILNHEQRHFDIAKIAAGHFEKKIKSLTLPVNNYDGPINMEYLDAYREMDKMQKQYDDETNHGTVQIAQQRWNIWIDHELKQLGIIN